MSTIKDNLNISSEQREFYVFVNPNDFLVKQNIGVIGSISSTFQFNQNSSSFMFLPNPEYQDVISPFQNGMLVNYMADYNLEIHRADRYTHYPSRLKAVFLLNSLEDAKKYKANHPYHVDDRILKKCITKGKYACSMHDAAWVDFLRLPHSLDDQTIFDITSSYWEGVEAKNGMATSFGKPWCPKSVQEVLFIGQLEFQNKDLSICELKNE